MILYIFFILSASIHSEERVLINHQRIVALTSEIYELVEFITIESGLTLLSSVKPWSEAEVQNILDKIDYSMLSKSGKSAFNRIKELKEKTLLLYEDGIAIQASVEIAAELYLHSSNNESLWEYGYEERLPVLSLPIEVWFNENFYAVMEVFLKESRFLITAVDGDGNYLGNITSIPMSLSEVNYHFPARAFMSTGGENWNLQIGRDQLEYGNGESSSLLLSSNPDFFDFIKLKGFSEHFAFTWTYINLESWNDSSDGDNLQKSFIDHVLEVRPVDFLTISLNESILMYGEDPELQFISPLLIYHNFFTWETSNSLMTLGLNFVPITGVCIYGEYALDQLQTGLELELNGAGVNSTPNADGHLLGVKASIPVGQGYINGFFEYIYTSPWMYLRSPEEVSFYWKHREMTNILETRANVIKPLGYEYGPDTIAFAGEVGYFLPGIFSAAFTVDYIIKGENNIETEYLTGAVAAQMISPTGTPQNKLVLSLNGSYQIFSFLTAQLDLAWLYINNYQHISSASVYDFQSAASLVFKI